MTEGEFNRRIIEQGENFWKRYAYMKQYKEGKFYPEFTQKDFIKSVIEDAKKEIFNEDSIVIMRNVIHAAKARNENIDYTMHTNDCISLLEKLEKWFGEPEK